MSKDDIYMIFVPFKTYLYEGFDGIDTHQTR